MQLITRRAWHGFPGEGHFAESGKFRPVFGGQQFEAGDGGWGGCVGGRWCCGRSVGCGGLRGVGGCGRDGGGGSHGDAEGASAGGEEGRTEGGEGQFEEVAAGEVVFGHGLSYCSTRAM